MKKNQKPHGIKTKTIAPDVSYEYLVGVFGQVIDPADTDLCPEIYAVAFNYRGKGRRDGDWRIVHNTATIEEARLFAKENLNPKWPLAAIFGTAGQTELYRW